jgi:hypothetical protein
MSSFKPQPINPRTPVAEGSPRATEPAWENLLLPGIGPQISSSQCWKWQPRIVTGLKHLNCPAYVVTNLWNCIREVLGSGLSQVSRALPKLFRHFPSALQQCSPDSFLMLNIHQRQPISVLVIQIFRHESSSLNIQNLSPLDLLAYAGLFKEVASSWGSAWQDSSRIVDGRKNLMTETHDNLRAKIWR